MAIHYGSLRSIEKTKRNLKAPKKREKTLKIHSALPYLFFPYLIGPIWYFFAKYEYKEKIITYHAKQATFLGIILLLINTISFGILPRFLGLESAGIMTTPDIFLIIVEHMITIFIACKVYRNLKYKLFFSPFKFPDKK